MSPLTNQSQPSFKNINQLEIKLLLNLLLKLQILQLTLHFGYFVYKIILSHSIKPLITNPSLETHYP